MGYDVVVRGLAAILLVLAACYSPTAPSGAPCDPSIDNCPSGQACVEQDGASICLRPDELRDGGVDGERPVDGPANDVIPDGQSNPNDLDGDGFDNDHDNCVLKANDQANEDGDRFGDACDPCPPSVDADPVLDEDNDGVSDDCDPHPQVDGDRITLFAGFTGPTVPAGLTAVGGWTFANGKARIALQQNQIATLTATLPTSSSETVSTNYTSTSYQSITTPSQYVGGGVFTHRGATDDGVVCQIAGTFLAQVFLWLTQLPQDTKLQQTPFNAVIDKAYYVSIARNGIHYACYAEEADGTPNEVLLDDVPGDIANPKAGVRFKAVTATVDWLMLITSP